MHGLPVHRDIRLALEPIHQLLHRAFLCLLLFQAARGQPVRLNRQLSGLSVHHDVLAFVEIGQTFSRAHDCRNTHSARQNRRVRIHLASRCDDAQNAVRIQLRQLTRG